MRRRIRSIGNTKKITKAMEMVASAKMRKAVKAVLATRDYANLAWATILHLAGQTDIAEHPLLKNPAATKRVGLILIGSNRGLCGGFNAQIAQKAIVSIKKHEGAVANTEIIALGSRSRDIIRGFGFEIVADFKKEDITLQAAEIAPVARLAMQNFIEGKYDKIFVAFTDYVSSLRQVPRVKQLLPIVPEPDDYLGVVGKSAGVGVTKEFIEEKQARYLKRGDYRYEYVFEPSAEFVLNQMLPRLIEMQIYQAVLESEASEHSARMMSMKNATDAADDMIHDLNLTYNRARQAGITQEIAEVSSGAAALRK